MKGWRKRAADVFADQGARAAKMKSAPGPGTTDLGYSTTPHPTKGVRPRARFRCMKYCHHVSALTRSPSSPPPSSRPKPTDRNWCGRSMSSSPLLNAPNLCNAYDWEVIAIAAARPKAARNAELLHQRKCTRQRLTVPVLSVEDVSSAFS